MNSQIALAKSLGKRVKRDFPLSISFEISFKASKFELFVLTICILLGLVVCVCSIFYDIIRGFIF